jgi:hypothetical protein
MTTSKIQGAAFRVLACFYDQDIRSFTDICERSGYPTDLGGYYLRQLVAGDYVKKLNRGQYSVTTRGKQHLAIHYGKQLFAQNPRLAVIFVIRQGDGYVVLLRTVQPFMHCAEWPAGMVRWGEPLDAAAERVAKSRLGLMPKLHMHGFFRRTDLIEDTIFDDKLFAVYTGTVADGVTISTTTATGVNSIMREDAFKDLAKTSDAFFDVLAFLQKGSTLEEHRYHLSAKDF